MNEDLQLISEAVVDIIDRLPGYGRQSLTQVWDALHANGMTLVGVPENLGGSGGDLTMAAAVLAAIAESHAPVPLAESTWLAAWLYQCAGHPVPPARIAAAVLTDLSALTEDGHHLSLSIRIERVPWARHAAEMVLLVPGDPGRVLVAKPDDYHIQPATNLAGEPRDSVIFLQSRVVELGTVNRPLTALDFAVRLAVARTVQSVGAMRAARTLTVQHAAGRVQFGSPLNRFQAVQHRLARLAAEGDVLETAAELAVKSLISRGDTPWTQPTPYDAAVFGCISTAYDAIGAVIDESQHLHGAMGFTEEHPLHHATTRLWSWRQEQGGRPFWLGHTSQTLLDSARSIWPALATT